MPLYKLVAQVALVVVAKSEEDAIVQAFSDPLQRAASVGAVELEHQGEVIEETDLPEGWTIEDQPWRPGKGKGGHKIGDLLRAEEDKPRYGGQRLF